MSPNITSMIEGLSDGEIVPSVTGKLLSSDMVKMKGKEHQREYAVINDGERGIALRIDDPDAQLGPRGVPLGSIISATCSNTPTGAKGLTLGYKDDQEIIIVGSKAQISYGETKSKKSEPEPEKPKRKSIFEAAAHTIIDAKMYLYSVVKERILAIDPDYPVEHIPAFTTGVFMDLSRDKVSIPTGPASVTEAVHTNDQPKTQAAIVKGEQKKPGASTKSSAPTSAGNAAGQWKLFVHPAAKKTLGDFGIEEIKKKLISWYYIQDRSVLTGTHKAMYDALTQCFEENDLGPKNAASIYFNDYFANYPADAMKKNKILKKFIGIASDYFNDDEELLSDEAAIKFIKNFQKMFEEAIKTV